MPQVAAKCVRSQQVDNKIVQQVVAQLVSVPWGHHRTIIDKCKRNLDKALFYVRRTIQNGWSRNSLLNWLSTDLYEREGKAQLAKCVADAERQIADSKKDAVQ